MLSGWPDSIAQDDEGNGSFSPIFNAQYSIAHDHRASSLNFFKAPQPADSPIRLAQNNGQGKITVAGATLSLPTFMQLVAEDTPFNDYLVGDNANNQLHSRRGNDQLQGKGGTDSYIIHLDENQGDTPRMIWIDNEDPHPNPQSDWLILPVAIEQINKISQVGNDIVLSHASPALGQFKVGLRNFMLDARYRHITVVDKRGASYSLDVDEQSQTYLGQKQSEIQATEGDDSILLSGAIILAGGSFHALAGNDTIFDSSELDRRLYGDAGNDILIASRSGRKTLEGGEGDDQLFSDVGNDILLGGTGNDQLMGGEGDDTYRYGQGDGDDLINDAGGHDTLLFDEGITHNDLRFKRAGNDLQITFLAKDTDRITVKHYFKSSAFQIEKIKMGRDEMRGDDIARLVQMIPSFPSSEREATSSVNPSLFTRDPNLAANLLSSH
ncbi:calcium-binding protein [Candidatus Regiella insecticola]|uniref:calcium-binding protein n=1 Tax=Candidatus Regiella insecticola TaxID=138073 RepID=UPI000315729E|nr:calcium-binding protein [Candidatus Regiella insecticola]